MVTPMMVQYLVGLCCLRNEPQAIEIIVGDMVFDEAAEEKRDVDVTVTIADEHGDITAFKAVEVSHKGRRIDVAKMEQIIAKLTDMPKVTHRAIFSTSGYTGPACLKARKRGVELYTLQRWKKSIDQDFPDFKRAGTPGDFLRFRSNLLFWNKFRCTYATSKSESFAKLDPAIRVLNKNGTCHAQWSTLGDCQKELLVRSTGALSMLEPAQVAFKEFSRRLNSTETEFQFGPEWPSSHTLDLSQDEIYLQLPEGRMTPIDEMTIVGFLHWRSQMIPLDFMILKNVLNDSVFAGAAIADIGSGDGRMFAMIFPEKGHQVEIHRFQIPKQQQNRIREINIGDNSYDGGYRISRR